MLLEKIDLKSKHILQEVANTSEGIRQPEIEHKFSLNSPSANRHLKKLINLGLIYRESRGPGKGYLYFLAPGLTREQVDAVINKSKQVERNLENVYTVPETNFNSTSDSVKALNGSVTKSLFQKSESTSQSVTLIEDDAEHIQGIKWLKKELIKKESEIEKL